MIILNYLNIIRRILENGREREREKETERERAEELEKEM